jgi:hypothetical protein
MTMSNENSSSVLENFPIPSGPTEKVLISVEVYENEKVQQNQSRGGNKSYNNGVAVYFPTNC